MIGAIARVAGGAMTSGGLEPAVAGIGAAMGALLGPLQQIQQIVGAIGQLVSLFNPGIVQQFQLALNDAMAVLGAGLVPVMQGITIYVRLLGDAFAKLLPVIQPLFDAIGQYIASFAAGFAPMIEAAAPFIELLTDVLVEMFEQVGQIAAFVQGFVTELIKTVAELFGLKSERFNKDATSLGFAARKTNVSSVEQFANDLFSSTAKNIYARQGGGKSPEAINQEIADALKEGQVVFKQVKTAIENLLAWLERNNVSGEGAKNAFKDSPKQVQDALIALAQLAKGNLSGAVSAVSKIGRSW